MRGQMHTNCMLSRLVALLDHQGIKVWGATVGLGNAAILTKAVRTRWAGSVDGDGSIH